jgi:SAC3/GANP family
MFRVLVADSISACKLQAVLRQVAVCRGTLPEHRAQPFLAETVPLRCLVQDRHRAIRQDLEMQNIKSVFAVRILEEMVRYTASTLHELCEGVLARSAKCLPTPERLHVP